ncbi:MAG: nucleotidyltransferase domain-containing protein [Rhizorhabdus sp.]
MQPVRQLVRVRHGSHLYGTSTPSSDQDFKGVHLPSGEAIILGRAENHIKHDVVSKAEGTNKNTAEAIDDESFSVQKFFEMLMKGDTVATEILFAPPMTPEEIWQGGYDPRWLTVQKVGKQLLNRQCKGFVGYCVRQAAKYGIKGSRMAAVQALMEVLQKPSYLDQPTLKLGDIRAELVQLCARQEHTMMENIPHPDGRECWHIVCCDRKMPETVFVSEAVKVYERVWENYGERARQAMTKEGIDWKAVSHAVRVAQQAIELLDTGKITFPRPNAAYLIDIKQGKLPYAGVSKDLEDMVAAVQLASQSSRLPEKSDHKLADEIVSRLYLEQVQ